MRTEAADLCRQVMQLLLESVKAGYLPEEEVSK
jgi:hypothetical protein